MVNFSEHKLVLKESDGKEICKEIEDKEFFFVNEKPKVQAYLRNKASKIIQISNVGTKENFRIVDNLRTGNAERMGIYCFVYTVNTSLALKENYSYSKIVSIQPQFVLLNKTKETL